MNIKHLSLTICISTLLLVGCDRSANGVKDSYLPQLSNAITIGEAIKTYKYFKKGSIKWGTQKNDRGVDFVYFQAETDPNICATADLSTIDGTNLYKHLLKNPVRITQYFEIQRNGTFLVAGYQKDYNDNDGKRVEDARPDGGLDMMTSIYKNDSFIGWSGSICVDNKKVYK